MFETMDRRLRIIIYLCKNRSARISELVKEFNVSRSTIKNDLQKILKIIPIYSVPGRYGGIYIMDNFIIGKQYLSEKQVEVLEKNLHKFEGEDLEIVKTILRDFSAPKKK